MMRNTTPSDGHVPVASEKRRAAITRLSRGLSNLLQAGSQVKASGLPAAAAVFGAISFAYRAPWAVNDKTAPV